MTTPTDSDRRKQREAAIRSQDEMIAEHLAQAQALALRLEGMRASGRL